MRRNERKRDSAFAMRVMETCDYATLSMVDEEGKPYAIPISPICMENGIAFHSATEGTKNTILASHPQVCVTAVANTRRNEPKLTVEYESAVVHGLCHLVTDSQEKSQILRVLCTRYAPSAMKIGEETIMRMLDKTAIYLITPTEIVGKENPIATMKKEGKHHEQGNETHRN